MKKLGSIAFMVFVALLLAGAMFTLSLMKRPLGPSLALDVPPAQPAAAEKPQAAAPRLQPDKTCGNSGQMSLIVVGQGLVENGNLYRSGAIRLVVVDFDRPAVSILSLPGELWVDAKALKDPAIPAEKLDLIYHHAFQKNPTPEDVAHVKGTQALAQAVVDNFAFVPDHYAALLQQPFVDLVDVLGGIDVDLPGEVVPANGEFGVYPQGPQHLSGLRALNLTRADTAAGYNAWARFDRQDIVLYGLLEAVLQPGNWDKADDLVKQARKAVLTDLSVDQGLDLKCMLEKVGEQAELLEVSAAMVAVDGQGRWIPDFAAIKDMIQGMYGD